MSFDRTNPDHLAALKSEFELDPISMGYDPNWGTRRILNHFNDGAKNVGGETTGEPFTLDVILEVTNPNHLKLDANFHDGQLVWLNWLVQSAQFRDEDLSAHRSKFRAQFPDGSNTVAALDAKTRTLGRIEVLFGEGTKLTRQDWFATRDS